MDSVLILGAGQVGTFAAQALAERGVRVIAADLRPEPAFFERFGPPRGAELVEVDILDAGSVKDLIRSFRVDRIVLSVGLMGAAVTRDPERAWRIQVDGAREVGRAALAAGVRRLLFVSSFAIYGCPAVDRLAETLPAQPRSEYGRSKAAAEEALAEYRSQGLDLRILRPCGIYGPCRREAGSRSSRTIDTLLAHSLSGRELALWTLAESADEYLYVKDLARAIALLALDGAGSEKFVFNVGAGRVTTAADLHRALCQAVPTTRLTLSGAEEGQPCARAPLQVDRIRDAVGFEPRYDLAGGLADYLRQARLLS